MNQEIRYKIAALHKTPAKICLVVTGASAGCQQLITSVPGASGTLLESRLPYDRVALSRFMKRPEKVYPVTEETALDMAARAWRNARGIILSQEGDPEQAFGVAVTGVIDAGRAQRGELRLHMAVRGSNDFLVANVMFGKDADNRSVLGREREGELSDLMALNLILLASGLDQIAFPNDHLSGNLADMGGAGSILAPFRVLPTVTSTEVDPNRHVLFDGSFNPWHHGHENIADEVELRTGKKVVYVITDSHPNKGPVLPEELSARVGQFCRLAPVLVTKGLKLYVDKAEAHPGFSRVIGADSLCRLLDPVYGVPASEVLQRLRDSGAHFFVADRPHGADAATFEEVSRQIPPMFLDMFTRLGTVIDASSTAARAAAKKS
jgi:hypothetical protein